MTAKLKCKTGDLAMITVNYPNFLGRLVRVGVPAGVVFVSKTGRDEQFWDVEILGSPVPINDREGNVRFGNTGCAVADCCLTPLLPEQATESDEAASEVKKTRQRHATKPQKVNA